MHGWTFWISLIACLLVAILVHCRDSRLAYLWPHYPFLISPHACLFITTLLHFNNPQHIVIDHHITLFLPHIVSFLTHEALGHFIRDKTLGTPSPNAIILIWDGHILYLCVGLLFPYSHILSIYRTDIITRALGIWIYIYVKENTALPWLQIQIADFALIGCNLIG